MNPRLQPGDRISKYRIIGPLGAGGMGEVYLAQDLTLERNVALKVLPAELVQSEERVHRFVQEAKSASSLNHPNIVTIYEIGHDVLRRSEADDVPEQVPVHFISMELVSGKTLAMLIQDETTDLRILLGYLAQAAEGLAKAHAAGIVHRDLKPGNIMVSADGFAKVLDFGLAKLTEKRLDPAVTNAPTVGHGATLEGVVMGTAGYMAPEQVQGKPVDHRADVFAFGCILYEASTRRRPFDAESSVETMHKILHDNPPPVETLNAAVPAELRRIIRRCLAKSPDQRLQSMKDLAIELREIVEEYDSLSASASSGSVIRSETAAQPSSVRRRLHPIWMLIALLGMVALAVGIWGVRGGQRSKSTSLPLLRVNSLTSRGDINECVLSKDGRYLGYLTSISGISSIHVLQVATGSDVPVISTQDAQLAGLSFSPDGNYLWYRLRKKDAPNYSSLMQIPSLGGNSKERVFDVDSQVSFSPDGMQIAFMRGEPQNNRLLLMIRDLDTGNERMISSFSEPRVLSSVSWSPDGKRLAAVEFGPSPAGFASKVYLIPASGGRPEVLSEHRGARLTAVDWMPDGKAVVLAGVDIAISGVSQIQLVTVPRGDKTPLTNDLSEYEGVSVAADGSIAATRQLRLGDFWVAEVDGGGLHQALSVSNPDRAPFDIACVDDEHIHYLGLHDQELHLFSIPISGGEARLLTSPGGLTIRMDGYRGGMLLTRIGRKDLIAHIWRVNGDGSDLRQITHGAGETTVDVTQDGHTVLYTRVDTTGLWLASTDGGEPRLVGEDPRYRFGGKFSPDGRLLAAEELVRQGDLIRARIHIFSLSDGKEILAFPGMPNVQSPSWGYDSNSFYFLDRMDSNWNLSRAYLQTQEVKRVTRITEGRIQQYTLAPDGRHIALCLRVGDDENVWVIGPDGNDPKQITQFISKRVFKMVWTADGRRLAIYAGHVGRDAVIMKSRQGA
jgi:serine/threonine protein kinase/Tol biopolymer transport system component